MDCEKFKIRYPEKEYTLDQDEEWVTIVTRDSTKKIRLHDYEEFYEIPGLYEKVIYDKLKCDSDRVICELLNNEIEKFLLDKGVIKVGFATQETMYSPEGIPSTDFTKILPDGQSAVCFAFPLDKEKIRAFLRKDLPNGRVDHNKDNFDIYIKIIKTLEICNRH